MALNKNLDRRSVQSGHQSVPKGIQIALYPDLNVVSRQRTVLFFALFAKHFAGPVGVTSKRLDSAGAH